MFSNSKKITALALAFLLGAGQAYAGLLIRGTEGLVVTGADGIRYEGINGLVVTGADGLLGLEVNGISWAPTEGLVVTGADAAPLENTDGVSFRAERADGVEVTSLDGLVVTGADGLVVTGADGTTHQVNGISVHEGNGLVVTGADGLVVTGADGLREVENNGLVVTGADGLVVTGADTIRLMGAAQVTAVGPDGSVYTIGGDGLVVTGADGLVVTGADSINMSNVQGLVVTGADEYLMMGEATAHSMGLQSFDPELAKQLEQATDDSHLNAAIVYHNAVTENDIAELRRIGVTGGTRFRVLPAVVISARPDQIFEISRLPTVRTVYGNRTLQWSADTSRETTGLTRAHTDADLLQRNYNSPYNGYGVAVAVLDTGVDGTHADLANRVSRNVKLADVQGAPAPDFVYPVNVENLSNTDLAHGHGTFVAGLIAGSGARANGRYRGYAPGAHIVGLSAGEANLFYVLAGFDYILQNHVLHNIRVVNCSFSSNGLFDLNDPVNVATKMLTDAGVSVVFSAGNTGPGLNTLNPYARAPWVVSVGATDERGSPAKFSARGDYASEVFRPTLVAPGVDVVSARASGVGVTGLTGLAGADAAQLSPLELPYYTTASGTSFSAPQVAGTIALMLNANPSLTPEQVRSILRRTATPLAPYLAHEVGAGMLNTHAALLEAAFPERKLSEFRLTLDRGQVTFVKDAPLEFSGTAVPGQTFETSLTIPEGVQLASVEIAWGPFQTTNDLGLYLHDAANVKRAESNLLNLPGITGRRERTVLTRPEAGTWRARVKHSIWLMATAQSFTGVMEIGRVEYAPLSDIAAYAGTPAQEEIRHALRTYSMLPNKNRFRPDAWATRAELAAALVQGARVPLYVGAQPMFADVVHPWTRVYVESAQNAPGGALFYDRQAGGAFNPHARLDRLTVAVALVRAAGLEAEAQAGAAEPFNYLDGLQVPAQWRGHVIVAVRRGFITPTDGMHFGPSQPVTRLQLARALSKLGVIFAQ